MGNQEECRWAPDTWRLRSERGRHGTHHASIPGLLGLPRIRDMWTLRDISCKRLVSSGF